MSDNWLNPLDLEDARKQVNRLLKTAEGKAALAQTFGADRLVTPEEAKRIEESKPRVAILVPTHKHPENETAHAYALIQAYSRDRVKFVPAPSIGSSVVHWTRNQLISSLDKKGEKYDYVLYMDDDMEPSPDCLVKMLDRKVDIVGAICTVRTEPATPNARVWNETMKNYQTADIAQPGFYDLNDGAIGTGLMLISKKALDDVGEYYLSCAYERKYLGMSKSVAAKISAGRRKFAEETKDKFWFRFYPHMEGQGEFGEDVSFCFAARECGYKIYGDATFLTKHIGSYGFSLLDYWNQDRADAISQGKVVDIAQPSKDDDVIVVTE